MTSKTSTHNITDKMIRFIYAKKIVHYADLEKYFGRSRATISKYLDQLEVKLSGTGIELVRKRNKGIYLKGDVEKLITGDMTKAFGSDDDLIVYLLNAKEPIVLDELAEKFYLSRSTLVRKLNELRDNYDLKIHSSKAGIWLDADSFSTRQAMIKLLKSRLRVKVEHRKQRFCFVVAVDDSVQNFLDIKLLQQVEAVINEFKELTHLKMQHYDFEILLLQTTLAVQSAMHKAVDTTDRPPRLSENTIFLANLVLEKFGITLPDRELEHLDKTVTLIQKSNISSKLTDRAANLELVDDLKKMLDIYDDILLRNLTVHIGLLLNRSQLGVKITNPYKAKIKRTYPLAMDQALTLADKLSKKYGIKFNEDEICFLALHFESFIERKRNATDKRLRVIIVCSTGYGSAMLLKQQINEHYSSKIKVLDTLSVDELMERQLVNVDLVISTIPLNVPGITSVYVTPLLTSDDQLAIEGTLASKQKKVKNDNVLFDLLPKDAIVFTDKTQLDQDSAIKLLVERLIKSGYVKTEMLAEALKRERLASTGLGDFAIPHGKVDKIISPVIGVLVAPQGIKWGKHCVKIAFFIALNQPIDGDLEKMYRYFYKIIQDPRKLKKLYHTQNATEFLHVLKQLYQEFEI